MYRLLVSSGQPEMVQQRRQSPIDIKTDTVHCDTKKCQADSLQIRYTKGDCDTITVTRGAGWTVEAHENCTTSLKASYLPAEYRFLQFHAHWSMTADKGSEHTVDGKAYAAEVHFVFWNPKYGTPCEAMRRGDGLAVVGVFLEEGGYNSDYAHITGILSEALEKEGKPVEISRELDMTRLIPIGSDMFHYEGSLTTPGYDECVMWTVLLKHLTISANQLYHFRQIVPENYRECQHLCGRKVYSSKQFE